VLFVKTKPLQLFFFFQFNTPDELLNVRMHCVKSVNELRKGTVVSLDSSVILYPSNSGLQKCIPEPGVELQLLIRLFAHLL
jgi:hypothetical protein